MARYRDHSDQITEYFISSCASAVAALEPKQIVEKRPLLAVASKSCEGVLSRLLFAFDATLLLSPPQATFTWLSITLGRLR